MILLQILRIIGIILLVILGLILFVLLLILCVPLRYRAGGEFYGKLKAEGRVSWLFIFLEFTFLRDSGPEFALKLGRKRLYPRNKDKKKEDNEKTEPPKPAEPQPAIPKAEEPQPAEPQPDIPKTEELKTAEPQPVTPKAKEPETEDVVSAVYEPTAERTEKKEKPREAVKQDTQHSRSEKKQPRQGSNPFEKASQKLRALEAKTEKYRTPEMKKAVKKVLRAADKLLRHILPRKAEGYLHYGLPSPEYTGYAAGLLSAVYAGSGGKFTADPDFLAEKAYAEGSLKVKGHFFLGYIGLVVLGLVLDGNIRKQYRVLRSDKE